MALTIAAALFTIASARRRKRTGGKTVLLDYLSQELRQLHRYWQDKAGDRQMPARRDIDPVMDLPAITPYMWLVDVEEEPPGFRFRLLGTEVVAQYGTDFTGRRLDELGIDGERSAIEREYRETVAVKRPTCYRHAIDVEETGRYLPYERLLLPLSDDGETVNMLMGAGFRVDSALV